jgi:hypothetical protein
MHIVIIELLSLFLNFCDCDFNAFFFNHLLSASGLVHGTPVSVVVCIDGGRYDVLLAERTRHSVYWEESESCARRCSWFYRGRQRATLLVPRDENFAELLEVSS